uniref:Uncharacterized protein n=1 Tax=Hyaloperonospora arabidopsidis (strain Emoy2) TaxID=559515 RepID=M4BBT1_HYAAE
MWDQKVHVVTSLLYPSSCLARLRLKCLTMLLHVHVMIQLYLICKLSKRRALYREKQERQDVPCTLIMTNNSRAVQDHLDTMNDITPITHCKCCHEQGHRTLKPNSSSHEFGFGGIPRGSKLWSSPFDISNPVHRTGSNCKTL